MKIQQELGVVSSAVYNILHQGCEEAVQSVYYTLFVNPKTRTSELLQTYFRKMSHCEEDIVMSDKS